MVILMQHGVRYNILFFDNALFKIRQVGASALLAKAEFKSAFHLLPICLSAFNSLGFYFQGEYYFDQCLPMGCLLLCHNFFLYSLSELLVVVQDQINYYTI